MLAHQAALLGTLRVVPSSLLLVLIFARLGVCKLSNRVAGAAILARGLLNDGLETLHDLGDIRVAGKADIVVSLVLEGGHVAVLRRRLDPVDTLRVVHRHFARACSFDQEATQNVPGVVGLARFVGDDRLELSLGHLVQRVEDATAWRRCCCLCHI